MSETAKHRELVLQYCSGNGVDLGSSGDPIVPWAIQVDLPRDRYWAYNTGRGESVIQWRGDALNLPFKDGTLDFVHSSHLIEDFTDWEQPLREWDRVLKVGGYLIIAVPDHERFRAYVQRGKDAGIDCDNLSHKHESHVGELSLCLRETYHVLRDAFVNADPHEHSILFVGRKRSLWGAK